MEAYGLRPPSAAAALPAPVRPISLGGVMTIQSLGSMQAAQRLEQEKAAQMEQAQPVITSLAGHIQNFWAIAKQAKQSVEMEMLDALRSRRGQYSPQMLADLKAQNSTAIYMMLFSSKCRQAGSLLRDILLGTGSEKPWSIRPTPVPDLPKNVVAQIYTSVEQEVMEAEQMGLLVSIEQIKQRLMDAKKTAEARMIEEARFRAERMEVKMEDQLAEGGFLHALDQFIDDLTTFKAAFIKGPVIRREPKMSWGENGELQVTPELRLHWERVDPFMIYPAPWAKCTNSAPFIERHRLTREDLTKMLGVNGYSDTAIRQVLDLYGTGGLNNWLTIDADKAHAEGRENLAATLNTGLIDALQYWGSVSGKILREWGMEASQVPDEAKEYQVEAWLIGPYVIKAVLNADPLGRRPYFKHSYEPVPGTFWGNSLYDLIRDCQDMCNAAARALVNNLGISSGPQVAVFVDRLAKGENITSMYPWKIWQMSSDPMGSTAKPIEFFQPSSNAAELMGVYEKFSTMADDYSGIPKYMTGSEGTPGAGRTASGLSMMIGNASKVIKQVIAGIDVNVFHPLLNGLYYYNMRYGQDPDLKGDVCIVPRGALSLMVKETAQVRRNEFLMSTANQFDMQIIGMEGRAEVLRESAKALDMNVDKVVPPLSVLRQRAAMMAMQMQAQQQQQGSPGGEQELMNGAPVTDNFSPSPA